MHPPHRESPAPITGASGTSVATDASNASVASGVEPSICIGCGLCCDGTLFRHLGVTDASDLGPALTQLGVEVIVEADPPVFLLPCPALAQGRCTIYHLQRPRACGWFECDVSRGVADGSISRADAGALIEDTKALRDAVRRGDAPPEALRARVARSFWRPDDD